MRRTSRREEGGIREEVDQTGMAATKTRGSHFYYHHHHHALSPYTPMSTHPQSIAFFMAALKL